MALHTTFAYGPGSATGADLTFTDTAEESIRDYGSREAVLKGVMVTNNAPLREKNIHLQLLQDPRQDEIELTPLCQNDTFIDVANVYHPIGSKPVVVGQDWTLQGFTAGGGDNYGVGLLLSYGQQIPGYNPDMPIIVRKYNAGVDETPNTWSEVAVINDLDPLKMYNIVGMMAVPENEVTVGARLRLSETGCRPGVTAGPMIMFPEGAAIIRGDSHPTIEVFSLALQETEVHVVFQELGYAPGVAPDYVGQQGRNYSTGRASTNGGMFDMGNLFNGLTGIFGRK